MIVAPFLLQLGGVIYNPCSRATIVHIVESDRRVAANSVMSLIENVTSIIAPFLASAILLFDEFLWMFFAFDGLSFVLSAVLLSRLGSSARSDELLTSPPVADESSSVIRTAVFRVKVFWSGVGTSNTLILIFISTFFAVLCGTWAWRMGTLFISVPNPDSPTWFYSLLLAIYAIAGILTGYYRPLRPWRTVQVQ
ncbi:MFS transporter [Corynebacterium poyangense]|uniref:MFS transporter n=1 Tax=Corynebacterium poyangense TaxID=2684405 RepID=UPI0037440791